MGQYEGGVPRPEVMHPPAHPHSACQVEYSIRGMMLEIYNENLRDLLVDDPGRNQKALEILSTLGTGSNVPNATQVCDSVCDSPAHAPRSQHMHVQLQGRDALACCCASRGFGHVPRWPPPRLPPM